MQLSSRIFANVWRKIRESFAKVDGPPRQVPDRRPMGPLVCCRAACELELWKRASRATLKLKGSDFGAGASEVYLLCVLLSYRKVATFKLGLKFTLHIDFRGYGIWFLYYARIKSCDVQKLTFRTTFVLKSCYFRAAAAKVYFVYRVLLL